MHLSVLMCVLLYFRVIHIFFILYKVKGARLKVIPIFGVVAMVLCSLARGDFSTRVIWVGSMVSSEGQITLIHSFYLSVLKEM